MKKTISLILVFVILMSSQVYAGGWFAGASNWAEDELLKAVDNKIITYDDFVDEIGGYSNKITREQFAELVMRMYNLISGEYPEPASVNTFSDTKNIYVLMANAAGIINGDGNGHFNPQNTITRQEMAVMMSRTLDSLNIKYNKGDGKLTIEDKDLVAKWAIKGVDFAFENGFIKGDGKHFNPTESTPIEQAVIILNRVYEKYRDQGISDEPNDYTKGYEINLSDNILVVKFNNNGQKLEVSDDAYMADYFEDYNKVIYYLNSKGEIYYYDFSSYNNIKNLGHVTKFALAESEKYGRHIIAETEENNKTVFKAIKVISKYDYKNMGEVYSLRDPNYQISEMYEEIEAQKNKFVITVNDPSQNMKNVKFSEDNMYFYSNASHYDYIENGKGYLRMYPYKYSDDAKYVGPMGRVGGENTQWTYNGFGGVYETSMKFNKADGNAGIVFNVRWAGDGNDNYAGYYAGVQMKGYKVILGRADYGKWTDLENKPMLIGSGGVPETIKLKVVKDGSTIKVYVNGTLYITKEDSTYSKNGGFGVRTWKSDVSYSDFTINPLPF